MPPSRLPPGVRVSSSSWIPGDGWSIGSTAGGPLGEPARLGFRAVDPATAQVDPNLLLVAALLAFFAYLNHRSKTAFEDPGDSEADDVTPVVPEAPPDRELLVDLPGGITLGRAEREAVSAAYRHLVETPTAESPDAVGGYDEDPTLAVDPGEVPAELIEAVYPEHRAGYDVPTRWYEGCVGPALAVLTNLDPPPRVSPDGDDPHRLERADWSEDTRTEVDDQPRSGRTDWSEDSRADVDDVPETDDPGSDAGSADAPAVPGPDPAGGSPSLENRNDRNGERDRRERFDYQLLEDEGDEVPVAVADDDHGATFLVGDLETHRPRIRVDPNQRTDADLDWLADAREYLWERAIDGDLSSDVASSERNT